jgi:hypothetical protein
MIRAASPGFIPSVRARFGDVSASIAIVFRPDKAKEQARVPAMKVFPTPPFPATAIFVLLSSPVSQQIFVCHQLSICQIHRKPYRFLSHTRQTESIKNPDSYQDENSASISFRVIKVTQT